MGSKMIRKRGKGKRELQGERIVGPIDWGFCGGQRLTSLTAVVRKRRWRGAYDKRTGMVDNDQVRM